MEPPPDQHDYLGSESSGFVGFEEDCLAILAYLPDEFGRQAVERWLPWLHHRYPELHGHRRRLFDQLARFEEAGVLAQLETGTWRKQESPQAHAHIDLGLTQGEITDRNELSEILQMDGPTALQRGMFKPASGPFEDQLLLFHDPHENPYGDVVGSEVIQYIGQGREGNQKLQGFNRYLAEHLKRGYQVHFFEKQDTSGSLNYRGEVVCEDVERVYRPDEGRSVLQFKLVQAEPISPGEEWTPTAYYQDAQAEIEHVSGQPRLVDREQRVTVAQRLVRNVAFRDTILEAYERTCAVCGVPLSIEDLTELQAAHIVAVSEQGPDDPRNGLSLCVRHHWAFDHGVFTLTDDLEVQSFLDGADPHGELEDGAGINAPDRERQRPHPFYVRHHREKWETAMG